MPELDERLHSVEEWLSEHNDNIICDYIFYYPLLSFRPKPIERFKQCVRRAFILNEYKRRKSTRLTNLINELKKKNEEEEKIVKQRRHEDEFKDELACIIRT